jgi:hypothetical protein
LPDVRDGLTQMINVRVEERNHCIVDR